MDKIEPYTKDEAIEADWSVETSFTPDPVYATVEYVDERIEELQTEIGTLDAKVDTNRRDVDNKFDEQDTKIQGVQENLDDYKEEANEEMSSLYDRINSVNNELNGKIDTDIQELDGKLSDQISTLDTTLSNQIETNAKAINDLGESINVELHSFNDRLIAQETNMLSLRARVEALEQNALQFDGSDNVVLRDGSKIIAPTIESDGSMPTHEILGLNRYENPDGTHFYQTEVGNMHIQTTLNTKEVINVDTEDGTEVVQYVSRGSKAVYTGDLSQTGSQINFALGNINISVSRIDSTTVGAIIRSDEVLSIPTTRRLSGAASEDTWRKTIVSMSTGSIFDSINVGSYLLIEYWITLGNAKYYIVAGSDEEENEYTLTKAWVEVYDAFITSEP